MLGATAILDLVLPYIKTVPFTVVEVERYSELRFNNQYQEKKAQMSASLVLSYWH